ncbi:uncharacterized protein PRCAT00004369001 [Priceomyces carsonii]|uniref:uncharacterized protein n=1 Tax=Priceomyces carsonii TaxID=28549 RepID=UPI002ED9CE73|nr:unnamed protein product [Priceomyces carsonii]
MFGIRSILYFIPIAASGAYFISSSAIENESKRHFYDDDADIVPIPGTIVPTTQEQLRALGTTTIIGGASVRSSKSLESFFQSTVDLADRNLQKGELYLNSKYHDYNETERSFTTTVSKLHDRNEDLLPNSLYILIAFLSGNIIARQRGIFARATVPVFLGLASFKYFLPHTFSNTASLFWNLEQQKLPALAKQQELAVEKTDKLVHKIDEKSQATKKRLEGSLLYVKRKLVDFSGLNIDEEVSKK